MKLNTASITPTKIHAIGSVLAIGILAFSAEIIYTSWNSQQSTIQSSKYELTQITTDLSTAQRDRARLANQISNLESIVINHQTIIQPTSINELAVQVVALAEQHQLQLEQFQPSPPQTLDQDQVQQIDLRLTANFQSVTNWLDQLHKIMPDIHVVAISIRSQSIESATVTSDIRLNWYIPTNDPQLPN